MSTRPGVLTFVDAGVAGAVATDEVVREPGLPVLAWAKAALEPGLLAPVSAASAWRAVAAEIARWSAATFASSPASVVGEAFLVLASVRLF